MSATVINVPVNQNQFGIKLTTDATDYTNIQDITSFKVKIEAETKDWTPMDTAGFSKFMVTGKKMTIDFQAKKNFTDTGNKAVAAMAWEIGDGCVKPCQWTMPDGTTVTFIGVFDVSTPGGGDSNDVDALEWKVSCQGKPTVTPPAA